MERVLKVFMLGLIVAVISLGISGVYADEIIPVGVTASYSYEALPRFSLAYAYDGVVPVYPWTPSWTAWFTPEWIEYDLGGLYTITESTVYWGGFLIVGTYNIEVPDGLGGWIPILAATNPAHPGSTDNITDTRVLPPTVTDRVRLNMLMAYNIGQYVVLEWDVFGTEVDPLQLALDALTVRVEALEDANLDTRVTDLEDDFDSHVHDKGSGGRHTSGPIILP